MTVFGKRRSDDDDFKEAPLDREIDHVERNRGHKNTDGDVAQNLVAGDEGFTYEPEEERKLIRKIDLMILPYLAVCYAFFYVDKTTLSYAAIFGIREDLQLVGSQYSLLSSAFYFGFLVWSLPTNLLLQRLPVGKYLGSQICLWGIFLMIQAACPNFASLLVLRILGGAAEAVSDPSFMLITAMWYTRREQPVRIGLWYTANGIGIALGGLLGYAIGSIKGSLASWKYEFLIIGALCTVWGIVMAIMLPDSPVKAKGFNDRQRLIAVERLRSNNTGIENKHFKRHQAIEAFCDYKPYMFFLIAIVGNVPNGGISNFGTIIIQGFGFSTLNTTLMQIPYGVLIMISILACVYINDRLVPPNSRCLMIVAFLLPNLAGALGLLLVPESQGVGRLICYYLTGPYNASFVLVLSLNTANYAGHTKKVIANACLFLGYCVGNIIGPFFYLSSQQAEGYPLGIASMIFSHAAEICLIILLRFLLKRENRKRDRAQQGPIDYKHAFEDLTDKENPNFRYVY